MAIVKNGLVVENIWYPLLGRDPSEIDLTTPLLVSTSEFAAHRVALARFPRLGLTLEASRSMLVRMIAHRSDVELLMQSAMDAVVYSVQGKSDVMGLVQSRQAQLGVTFEASRSMFGVEICCAP